ncbi:MAG: hypothetical protein U1F57_01465 [bacterium]
MAVFQSYERYGLSHEKTIHYYLGNPEEGDAMPKPLSYLVPTTHVHSFTMPLVFMAAWIALQGVPLRSRTKKWMILGGTFSVLIYNAAPYLVRYMWPKAVLLFTVGGTGLFLFFFWPTLLILYETWIGFKD